MTVGNLFIVGGIIITIFCAGVWLTISEFRNIEENITDRRKHIEEDMKIKDKS